MAQISGQGRWLIRLIVVKKLLLAGVLLAISLAAVFGDVHYAELSDFAETWGKADRQFLSSLAVKGTLLGPTRLMRLAFVSGLYAALILVAAWATWVGRRWGEWLLVGVLGLALPLELVDALHEQSPRTWIVLGLTVIGLVLTTRMALSSERRP
ncbi:hypothetical protein MITS9509_03028 [Synechococcus sp. MIT S9509]|uniref:DUF2127 domain-containing protein n=1 Tax=unclassified Synechococcus TaxID=2626047 RepID=UPI0007BC05B3|nr:MULTISPECIES: DUF2127 domain-containing protein [unclassified Synechococcus]KZR85459.1 hypothetical protein MITS9504_01995 [Synechococcus sp. MIT S9504]KZR89472.1 hypothetical protein MITS9509_03028 [Synechococcus sp. MIT S9509]